MYVRYLLISLLIVSSNLIPGQIIIIVISSELPGNVSAWPVQASVKLKDLPTRLKA
jgi:hypothetical protein